MELVKHGDVPYLYLIRVVLEGDWYVTGYDSEDDSLVFAVVEASGPSSFDGIAFEELA